MQIKLSTGKSFNASSDESLLIALKKNKIYLNAHCGGKGTCGKCKIQILEGDYRSEQTGKLSKTNKDKGILLACRTFPKTDMLIEIPEDSKLVIGDKIAISRSGDLAELFKKMDGVITPLVKRLDLKLTPPTIEDNISDLERIKRELLLNGISEIHFPYDFILSFADKARKRAWSINLAYYDEEALFIDEDSGKHRYAAAVDIGTTTIVVYLVDLNTGKLIDTGSTYNSQIKFGDDVITRIIYATEKNGLNELREEVVEDINDIIQTIIETHNLKNNSIESAVISGNTIMLHIFWGLDPRHIREEPYIPTANFFPLWKADKANIQINSSAPVYTLPCIASYVGGDIVSGVLASNMHRSKDISLFMDIGTNGEIAIGNNEWLVTAACSAGPCFEGSGIKHGMRATEGAIEDVKLDADTFEPKLKVIGNVNPSGICGSGMIDAIAEMFLKGAIDMKGKFVTSHKTDRIQKSEDGMEFVLYKGKRDIVLTEVDIENILRAKAAMYAGVSLLIKEVGFTLDNIEHIYIAGGFGNFLDVEKAVILGMLPDLPREKFKFLGNTSITGAYLCVLSERLRKEAEDIARKMTYIELSTSRNFMDEYMSALFLPHTNIGLFPTVQGLLKR
ncbi:MAG: ASKHA domain-containing protein [Nitrospiraceae bacterium]|nr:ASKHA domain-containing protein [Nitrospiraceae bacterium]